MIKMPDKKITFPIIETEHITLRELKEHDSDMLFTLFSNKLAMKYWDTDPHENIDATHNAIHKMKNAWCKNLGVSWGIIHKERNLLIGVFILHSLSKNEKEAQLGYILNPEFWGNGHAGEALSAAVHYCFNQAGIKLLQAEVDPNNTQSISLLTKHKFILTKSKKNDIKLNNKYHDTNVYALSNSVV